LEKIFVSYSSDKVLISKIRKELQKLSTKRINNPINNWTNELDSSKRIKLEANKYMKKCSIFLAIMYSKVH
jgi:hypothetical protein